MTQAGAGVFVGPLPSLNVAAPPPTGIAAIDMAALQATANDIAAAGGGTLVPGGRGTYALKSTGRLDATVSYTGSGANHTWTDAAITAADLGKYLVGSTGTNPLLITAVTPGVGFTTNNPPFNTITNAAAYIIQFGLLFPPGVKSAGFGGFASSNFTLGTQLPPSLLLDSGTGISVGFLGAPDIPAGPTGYGANWLLEDWAVWGATGGGAGNTIAGVLVPNGAWLSDFLRCDIAYHGTAGVLLDSNMNNVGFWSTAIRNNGKVGATSISGGVICPWFYSATSACVNFYNSFVYNNFGVNVGALSNQEQYVTGSFAVNFYGSQSVSAQSTSWALSGWGLLLQGGAYNAVNVVSGLWSGTCAVGDVMVLGGLNSLRDCALLSAQSIDMGGAVGGAASILNLDAVISGMGAGNCIVHVPAGSQINWSGCQSAGAPLYSGGPSSTQMKGVGTNAYLATPVAKAVTVTANAGTVPVSNNVSNFTNSSAATMAVTMATAGAMDGQVSIIRIYDFSAVAQIVGWTNTENSTVSVPLLSNGSTTAPLTVTLQFNAATSKWRCIESV